MAKSMLVTLPFVLLLLDYWPLRRFQALSTDSGFKATGILLWEKVPFLSLTIASCIMTVWAQYDTSLTHLTFPLRVVNAIISYVSYLRKIFLPVDLAVIYPFVHSFPLWQILGSAFILIGVTAVVIYYVKKQPFLFVGWFWYLGTLVPVSGLVSVNAPMADHYTYLPSIGIGVMLAWGMPLLFKSEFLRKTILFPAAIFLLIIISDLTWHQCGYWKSNLSLFNHALRVTKNNYLALTNLGDTYSTIGHYQQAFEHFTEAIRMKPDYVVAYNNRGNALCQLGQYQRAIEDYNEAIRMKHDYALAYSNRGVAYFLQSNNTLGCRDVQRACKLGNCKILESAKGRGFCR
jgi:protein O-mannosyl-transferase